MGWGMGLIDWKMAMHCLLAACLLELGGFITWSFGACSWAGPCHRGCIYMEKMI
jgi:hypothetical protein